MYYTFCSILKFFADIYLSLLSLNYDLKSCEKKNLLDKENFKP